MSVRVELRMTQLCVDTLLKPFRDEMFEALGLLVNLLEWVVQHFVEEGFDEAMMAHHLKSAPFAGRRRELRDAARIPRMAA